MVSYILWCHALLWIPSLNGAIWVSYVEHNIWRLSWRISHPAYSQDWSLGLSRVSCKLDVWRWALLAHGPKWVLLLISHHLVTLDLPIPAAHSNVVLARPHLLALDIWDRILKRVLGHFHLVSFYIVLFHLVIAAEIGDTSTESWGRTTESCGRSTKASCLLTSKIVLRLTSKASRIVAEACRGSPTKRIIWLLTEKWRHFNLNKN